MAWDFLRKFLKLVGGKMMTKLAPRLLLFQYYDRVNLEIQQQKKKYRVLFHKSQAELRIYRMLYTKSNKKLGISSILQERMENASEVSAIQVNGFSDFADDRTVSSHYEEDDSRDYEFIELQAFRYAGNRALYRTYDYNSYFTEIEQHFGNVGEIEGAGWVDRDEEKRQSKVKKVLLWFFRKIFGRFERQLWLIIAIYFLSFLLTNVFHNAFIPISFSSLEVCNKYLIMTTHLKSLRHMPSLKTQKEIKEEHQKEEFFQRLMQVIDEQLTEEQHQFLLHFVIQNRKGTANNHIESNKGKDSIEKEECPLAAIKDNIFRETKKQKVREKLLTEEYSDRQAPMPTSKNIRINRKHHMATVFLQKQNREQVAFNRSCTKNDHHFKIYPIKKTKKSSDKSFQSLLHNQSLKVYNNNFLTSLLDTDISQDQFNDTTLQPQPTPDFFSSPQHQKYTCLHSIQFQRPLRRNRTALKLHSRKF